MSHSTESSALGAAGRLAAQFINSKLTPLIVIASVLLGVAAVALLPREEEPQIKVPMIDVMVSLPGFSAAEVEERAARPMEKLLWEVPGVEYIYSMSKPGECLTIVRFQVGEDVERSLVKLNQKLQSNFDRIPPGVSAPLVKARSIDDVPVLALTFHSKRYDHYELRRVVAQVDDELKRLPQVSESTIIGGFPREVRVELDPARLAARGLTVAGLLPVLRQANQQRRAGAVIRSNTTAIVESGGFIQSADDLGDVVVGAFEGRPVYLREVATLVDGPAEADDYVLYRNKHDAEAEPAVTLTLAKRPGANAVTVTSAVLARLEQLKGRIIPSDLEVTISRHYGRTAEEKSNELLFHMGIAVISVAILILLSLGWRESLVVAIAIPATLALTLLVFYLVGFTLNRITLFALIFSIGILVDDAIVVVENIVRHMRLPSARDKSITQIAVEAVNEVGNPTILATFAVIAAVLPMASVGGLMGPYMRPIPIGATAAMMFSLFIAFIVTPWAAIRLLPMGAGHEAHTAHSNDGWLTALYRRAMRPLLDRPSARWGFLIGIAALLLAAMAFVPLGWVKVKMLPFDNKSEFQVILNMPEGSALELTARAANEIAVVTLAEPEVTDTQLYVGTAAPYNFNGLVRHYFFRRGPAVADVQVNLVGGHERSARSHDIAKRVRPAITKIAQAYGARVAIAEVPPGPPVLQTLVAEIYGVDDATRERLAEQVSKLFQETPGVVDVDRYFEADQAREEFVIDREKAALHGISAETIANTLGFAVGGASVGIVHIPTEKEDVQLRVRLPQSLRTSVDDILSLRVRSGDANGLAEPGSNGLAPLIPLRELVTVKQSVVDKTRYRKNLLPVSYVIGDVAGEIESPVYALSVLNEKVADLSKREFGSADAIQIYNAVQPSGDETPAIKWDGEWHITIEVFRDLGLAFAAVLVIIYMLMVGWFGSFVTPIVVMAAIPFSLVGILPGHALMGAFFSAPSMIGFMAGAGIVVRNSIILVDFIEERLKEGLPLHDAVIEAGAVRFRPMVLTALAVVVGAGVILFDTIFQGLALSLIAGEIASLLISRMAVPVLYVAAREWRS